MNSTRLYDQSTFIEIFQSFEEPRTSLKESDIPEKLTTSTFPSSNNDPVNHARVCAGRYLNLNTSLKENLATPEE
ncbi:MAG: hypothetical protein JWN78_821 [Bacteroidota bacterium]|nr:hypothetical protein [Bacteroidota bacterium]